MSNPIPRIGPDGMIRCMSHPDRTAAALQCASLPGWSDALGMMKFTPLLRIAPIADFDVSLIGDTGAIFWGHVKNFFEGNAALGMCSECAVRFWWAFKFPPLYVNQHAIFSNHVTIAKATIEVDFESHTFPMMRLETPSGLSNSVELICPECIVKRYPVPHPISLDEFAYA